MVTAVLVLWKDCTINVDKKHPDRYRKSYECRGLDRGKGKLTFKQVILQVSAIKSSFHYLNGYDYGGVGGVGCGYDDRDSDDDDDGNYDDHDVGDDDYDHYDDGTPNN